MPRVNKHWKIKDIEYLKLMYPIACKRIIAAEMGLTETAVDSAIRRYQIKKKP